MFHTTSSNDSPILDTVYGYVKSMQDFIVAETAQFHEDHTYQCSFTEQDRQFFYGPHTDKGIDLSNDDDDATSKRKADEMDSETSDSTNSASSLYSNFSTFIFGGSTANQDEPSCGDGSSEVKRRRRSTLSSSSRRRRRRGSKGSRKIDRKLRTRRGLPIPPRPISRLV